jgi:hypothetical protein
MLVSKEIQEKVINEYLKNNSVEKTDGFICGMNKAFEIVDKILKEEKWNKN